MAAVGQMFYTSETDWYGAPGCRVPPLTLGEALKAGGLDWDVGSVSVVSPDRSATSNASEKAIVRLDLPAGDPRRILGIVPQHFVPVQNREACATLDAVFGNGKSVYHTGGYLGDGETVWLLAKIGKTLRVGRDDIVLPYALMVNGHDGRHALTIRLTSVRVVCDNTLALATHTSVGPLFHRDHREASSSCAEAATEFFAAAMQDLDVWQESFVELSRRTCSDAAFRSIVRSLFPDPKQPRAAMTNPRVFAAWERRLLAMRAARAKIEELRDSGKGMSLPESRGTFWGALNAVTEYVDHHRPVKGPRFVYSLLGRGMDLKIRAFDVMQMAARGTRRRGVTAIENIAADLLDSRVQCA
jgi:phage/plasmid-like protein (TIGR03299 family)